MASDVQEVFKGKSATQLSELQKQIERKLRERFVLKPNSVLCNNRKKNKKKVYYKKLPLDKLTKNNEVLYSINISLGSSFLPVLSYRCNWNENGI